MHCARRERVRLRYDLQDGSEGMPGAGAGREDAQHDLQQDPPASTRRGQQRPGPPLLDDALVHGCVGPPSLGDQAVHRPPLQGERARAHRRADAGAVRLVGDPGSHGELRCLLPDEIEYLCAKALGWDQALSFQGITPSPRPANARQEEY